jgi:hypothetical protein
VVEELSVVACCDDFCADSIEQEIRQELSPEGELLSLLVQRK